MSGLEGLIGALGSRAMMMAGRGYHIFFPSAAQRGSKRCVWGNGKWQVL